MEVKRRAATSDPPSSLIKPHRVHHHDGGEEGRERREEGGQATPQQPNAHSYPLSTESSDVDCPPRPRSNANQCRVGETTTYVSTSAHPLALVLLTLPSFSSACLHLRRPVSSVLPRPFLPFPRDGAVCGRGRALLRPGRSPAERRAVPARSPRVDRSANGLHQRCSAESTRRRRSVRCQLLHSAAPLLTAHFATHHRGNHLRYFPLSSASPHSAPLHPSVCLLRRGSSICLGIAGPAGGKRRHRAALTSGTHSVESRQPHALPSRLCTAAALSTAF